MSNQVQVVKGDATEPQGEGPKVLIHCCNDEGKWGSGFVLALSKRWKEPEKEYRAWSRTGKTHNQVPFVLGEVQFVQVEEDLFIANMVAQKGIKRVGEQIPLRYPALKKCLERVFEFSRGRGASVHCPFKMGADRAGGNWEEVVQEIEECICSKGLEVTAYRL